MISMKKCFLFISLSLSLMAASVMGEEMPEPLSIWENSNVDGVINREKYADVPLEKLRKDDFYAAVNYDWLCDTELTADKVSVSAFDEAQNNANQKMLELLENHQLEGALQDYYDYLTDWDAREATWMATLDPEVQTLKNIQTLEELKEYLLSEDAIFFGNAFYTFDIEQWENGDCYLRINNNHLYSCSVDDEPVYVAIRSRQLHDIMMFLLPQFGYSEEESAAVVRNAMDFEQALSEYMYTSEEKEDPSILYEEMYWEYTLEELEESFPQFPMAEMLTAYGYTDFSGYVVVEPIRLWGLDKLFAEENVDGFRDYLLCAMLMSYAHYSGKDNYQEVGRIASEAYGLEECPSLETWIFDDVVSEFSVSLTDAFVEYYMTPEIKEDVTALVEQIKDTYIALVSEVEWLSDTTKAKAIKKLEDMDMFVAYEDDFEYHPAHYSGIDEDIALIDLVLSDIANTDKYILDAMNGIASQEEESEVFEEENFQDEKQHDLAIMASTFEINAFYYPKGNAIIIPALILTEPFYSIDMPKEEKMGKIGMVIAHEISHAFGPQRVEFNDGNVESWWGEEDQQYYDVQVEKLVRYLDRLVILPNGTTYSGDKVKNEMIADILAMQCMIRMANKDITFDYRPFFEAYASTYRAKNRLDEEKVIVETSYHPLDYLRVNITVSQFPEFQVEYKLKPGDRMYQPAPAFTFWDSLDVLDHYGTMLEDHGSLSVYLPKEKPELQDDFYHFVNYDGLSNLYLPDDTTNFRLSFSTASNQKISADISDYAYDTVLRKDPSTFEAGSLRQKIWDLYQCASDKEARDAIGWQPIQGWLQQIDEMETIEDYLDYEAEINPYGLHSFLNCHISPFPNDTSRSMVKIKNRFIAFPESVWLTGKPEVFESFSSDIQALLESAGYGESEAQEAAETLIELIKADCASMADNGELKYQNISYSLDELQELFTSVDIKGFLSKNGLDTMETYSINSPSYIAHLNEMLTDEHLDEIRLYAKAMLLYDLKQFGPTDISEIGNAEWLCGIISNMYSSQIRTAYIQELATVEAVSYMEQMAQDIIDTYKEMIDVQDWLSDVTKTTVKDVLDSVEIIVAVPKTEEESASDFEMVPMSEGGSWLQNMLNYKLVLEQSETDMRMKQERVKISDQPEKWANDNMQISYMLPVKKLVIPVILLQQPYYYGTEEDEMNYGILGTLIADQLAGVIIPATGTMPETSPMTEEELEEYSRRLSVISEYFDQYEIVPDHFVNGELQSYSAARTLTGLDIVSRLMEKKGLDRTRMYGAFALSRMEAVNEKMLTQKVEQNSAYIPESIRVNYILSNIDDFYDTFNITENDAMYIAEDERVRLWNG